MSLRDALLAAATVSGIRLEPLTATRAALALPLALGYAGTALLEAPPLDGVVAVFVLVFVVRFGFLFASFGESGLASWFKRALGEERGFALYESLTAVQFCLRAVSFGALLAATQGSLLHPGPVPVVAGFLLIAVGTAVNVWATMIVGGDGYFYRDLFLGRLPPGEFKAEGPYRLFSHPMYGPGQAGAYGAALIAGSWPGLVAAAANQLVMYLFLHAVERPHLAPAVADD